MDPDTLQTSALLFVTSSKSEAESREISGIATTIEPDTLGDVVIPAGASFGAEVSLFLEHDRKAPVGVARLQRHPDKITFTGWLPKIAEPGPLRDRVDLAWQSVKYRLIRAVSVRLSALKTDVDVHPTTGARTWRKFRVDELSLVTMPAHVGAQILSVKHVRSYLSDPAAFGHQADPSTSTIPGDSGPVRTAKAMTSTQQIAQYESTRAAKILERDALMAKATDAGVTLDDDQGKTYDALESEIKSLETHLGRMQKTADDAKANAKQVTTEKHLVTSPRVTVTSNTPPGIGLARLWICKAQQILNPSISALEFAQHQYRDDVRVIRAIKATVDIGLPGDPEWAGALVNYQDLATEFLEYLRPRTILGQLQGTTKVPFNARIFSQTTGGSANWVGAGRPKPVTSFEFAPQTIGFAKVAAISVLAEETIRLSNPSAETLVRDALTAAVVERLDLDFIDPDVTLIANVRPASITNGVAPLTSSGSTPDDVRADLLALLAALMSDDADVSGMALIMPNALAIALAMQVNALGQPVFPGMSTSGGTLAGIQVIASQYAAKLGGSPAYGNVVVAVDAPDILLADEGGVKVDASREAAIEMSDTPGQVPTPTYVSMWQSNCVALRAERHINWAKARPNAAAWMAHVDWSGPAAAVSFQGGRQISEGQAKDNRLRSQAERAKIDRPAGQA